MIMPCMNSTSACDRSGSVALVDGGSTLLGLPGAPGCTTTGVPGSVCCADIAPQIADEKDPGEQKKTAAVLAPTSSRIPAAGATRRAARDSALSIICASFADPVRSVLLVEYVPIPRYRYDRYRTDIDTIQYEAERSSRELRFSVFSGLSRPSPTPQAANKLRRRSRRRRSIDQKCGR